MGIISAIVRLGKGIVETLLCKSIALTETWEKSNRIRLYEKMGFKRTFEKEFVNQNGTQVKSY
ncbi:hypothetical protein [Bacillus sp. Bos-x628]|uniref:hypothetical protein n=1 Tax=Bacillus maqinnsis TaxID=3229854 RepID=UPI00338FA6B0